MQAQSRTVKLEYIDIFDSKTNQDVNLNPHVRPNELPKEAFTNKTNLYYNVGVYYDGPPTTISWSLNVKLYYQALGDCMSYAEYAIDPAKLVACNGCTPRRYEIANPPIFIPEAAPISCALSNAVEYPRNSNVCYPEAVCDVPATGKKCIKLVQILQPPTIMHEYCQWIDKLWNEQNITGTIVNSNKDKKKSSVFNMPRDAAHGGKTRIEFKMSTDSRVFGINLNQNTYYVTTNNSIRFKYSGIKTLNYYGLEATLEDMLGTTPNGGDGVNYLYRWESSTDNGVSWSDTNLPADYTSINMTVGKITKTTWYRRLAGKGTSISNILKVNLIQPNCDKEKMTKYNISYVYKTDNLGCQNNTIRISQQPTYGFEQSYNWSFNIKHLENYNRIKTIRKDTTTSVPYIDIDTNVEPYNRAFLVDGNTLGLGLMATLQPSYACGIGKKSEAISIEKPRKQITAIIVDKMLIDQYMDTLPNPNNTDVLLGAKEYGLRAQPNGNYIYSLTQLVSNGAGVTPSKISYTENGVAYTQTGNITSQGFEFSARLPYSLPSCAFKKRYDIESNNKLDISGYYFIISGTQVRQNYIRVPAFGQPSSTKMPKNTESFTMEAWVQPNANPNNFARYPVFASPGYEFGIDPIANKLYFINNSLVPNSKVESDVLPTGTFTDGQCRHLAITKNSTEIKFYINGVLAGTRALATNIDIGAHLYYHIGANISSTYVPHLNFLGVIKECRIWNYPRQQSEIQTNLYKKIDRAPKLISYIRLNDGAGSIAKDFAEIEPANGELIMQLSGNANGPVPPIWNKNICPSMIFRKEATEEQETTIENLSQTNIYPNPTDGKLFANVSQTDIEAGVTFELYDIQGKKSIGTKTEQYANNL